ncbi:MULTISPECIES: hypothetical protein [unclassified Paenibacillus]|uniref:hypothetical protein n=1 Tax=unclassified Paenibacillus TaxID=185978 RepID=UPI000953D7DD|nr:MULTISPECIES: hypothetical protein [unclassified Paenibacillus]ASS68568.1 hypothetical protein CIC07_22330 [Paenibacillus sp. RUD330]SIR63595.1 hypothetical protein SAMN05880555_4524 [Paenibacillus sp. RU4X]SIR71893.1 hypothetical protein SAMN05880570_4526 [Paenibacillus sp. RU4T]
MNAVIGAVFRKLLSAYAATLLAASLSLLVPVYGVEAAGGFELAGWVFLFLLYGGTVLAVCGTPVSFFLEWLCRTWLPGKKKPYLLLHMACGAGLGMLLLPASGGAAWMQGLLGCLAGALLAGMDLHLHNWQASPGKLAAALASPVLVLAAAIWLSGRILN